jgi:hypothetical protein
VEKICSEGSNTDCQVKGEFAVLEQYAELTTAKLFAADEEGQPKKEAAVKDKDKEKEKAKTKVAANAPILPAEAVSASKKTEFKEEEAEKSSMKIVLKPIKKSRAPASIKESEKSTKKFCIAKTETTAPEALRGKCATRTCFNGKCTYHGRKAVFEWGSHAEAAPK